LLGREGCDFSFAGLKTACAREVERLGALTDQDKADLCASFQAAVFDIIEDRTRNAMRMFDTVWGAKGRLVAAGGVAANQAIRGPARSSGGGSELRFHRPAAQMVHRQCGDDRVGWG
jgi:N6-L-threonylcarbamoyladenine synthase